MAFLDGNPFQRNAVKQFASEWLSKDGASNVEFVFDDSQTSHIRITFEADLNDNRSLIGRQALTAKNKAPTMWLGDVRDDVSPVRVAQVIRHEFGHALGMRHEHQHPKGGIRWNEPVVLGELASYGWSADMVRRNIFNVYSVSYVCVGAADFDPHSIMMYPIKKAWTLDGYQVGDNNDIVPADLKCVHSLYSK